MRAQEILSEPHGAPLLQLHKPEEGSTRDFFGTGQPRVRSKRAEPITERSQVVSSSIRRSAATAAAAKLDQRPASFETQQTFGTPPTGEAEPFDPFGELMGQGKYS
jgi:hypothetical protein